MEERAAQCQAARDDRSETYASARALAAGLHTRTVTGQSRSWGLPTLKRPLAFAETWGLGELGSSPFYLRYADSLSLGFMVIRPARDAPLGIALRTPIDLLHWCERPSRTGRFELDGCPYDRDEPASYKPQSTE
jgi:hypothetical protein